MKGSLWQEYIDSLLFIKYNFGYVSVPDKTQGDNGIEGYSKDGIAYQCYSSESDDLYESQRNKLTNSINKFIDNNLELSKIFDQTVIFKWAFVIPSYNNKALLKHATSKAQEVREKNLKNVSPDFEIIILTEKNFWEQRQIYRNDKRPELSPSNPYARILYERAFYESIPIDLKESLAYVGESVWLKVTENLFEDSPRYPWFDRNMPMKAADNFSLLFMHNNLSQYEVSLLYLLTLLREEILTSAICKALNENFNLFHFEIGDETQSDHQKHYIRFALRNPRFKRKIELLCKTGKHHEAKTLALWFLKKSVVANPKIWRDKQYGGLFDFQSSSLYQSGVTNPTIKALIRSIDMLKLVHYHFKEATSFDPSEEKVIKEFADVKLGNGANIALRLQLTAMALSIVERMSFDLAGLDETIIDYYESDKDFRLEALVSAINECSWICKDELFLIKAETDHPVVDYIFRSQVDILNSHTSILSTLVRTTYPTISSEIKIYRYSPDRIEILEDLNGKPIFKVPHLSFKLAEAEVKELIIGGALYSDQNSAIRELYQNALDACRLRKARLQYLARKEGGDPNYETDNYWQGKITFSQGEEHGRKFIEVYDNGIGMGLKEIRECFAKAGRKYTDQNDFFEEKMAWDKVIPPVEVYPNSMFGIGVFSYFLISDEIKVTTRRMNQHGGLEEAIEVSIVGNGNLCRIKIVENNLRLERGGTIVKLFLNTRSFNTSLVHALSYWLYISDFETIAIDNNLSIKWPPNQFNCESIYLKQQKIVPTSDDNVFLCVHNREEIERGIILQDGIKIQTHHQPFIVNYIGKNKNKLTVDRNRILTGVMDVSNKLYKETDPITCQYIYQNIEEFSLQQLSKLTEEFPFLMDDVILKIKEARIERRIKFTLNEHDLTIDIASIGVFPFDHWIIRLLTEAGSAGERLKFKEEFRNQYCNEMVDERVNFLTDFYQSRTIDFSSPFITQDFFPLDYYCLHKITQGSIMFLSLIKYPFIATYILAPELNTTAKALFDRLSKFKSFGLVIPEFDFDKNDLAITDEDRKLVKSISGTESGWFAGEISIHEIAYKSFELKITIGEVLSRLEKFERYNIVLPIISDAFKAYHVSDEDLSIISFNPNKGHTSFWGNNPKVDLRRIIATCYIVKNDPSYVYNRFSFLQELFEFKIEVDKEQLKKMSLNRDTNRIEFQPDESLNIYIKKNGLISKSTH